MFTIDGKITALVLASLVVALFFPTIPRTVSLSPRCGLSKAFIVDKRQKD